MSPENRLAFTVKEFAALTGLCTKTVRILVARGELRAARVGRKILIAKNSAESFLKRSHATGETVEARRQRRENRGRAA